MYKTLWRRRSLLWAMVRRQYQLRYRQSLGGFAWAIIPPIANLVVATIVFHRVIGVNTGKVPYALFTLAGLTSWTFLASGLSMGVTSVISNMPMVARLAFPRSTLPLGVLGTALIDLGMALLVFVVYAIVIGAGVPWTVVWIPVLILIELAFVGGAVLFFSALNVFARDIRLVVPLVLQLGMFLTPVMYPLTSVKGQLRTFYLLNPMTGLVQSFRDVLIAGRAPDLGLLAPALVGSFVAFLVGSWYFAGTETRFADVI